MSLARAWTKSIVLSAHLNGSLTLCISNCTFGSGYCVMMGTTRFRTHWHRFIFSRHNGQRTNVKAVEPHMRKLACHFHNPMITRSWLTKCSSELNEHGFISDQRTYQVPVPVQISRTRCRRSGMGAKIWDTGPTKFAPSRLWRMPWRASSLYSQYQLVTHRTSNAKTIK
jgi:hypothetical protein